MNEKETKTSWLKKNWYLIVIPVLCVALIISLAFLTFQNRDEKVEPTPAPVETTVPTVEPSAIPCLITITHNPTDETRNLGTDWYYDASRNMRYNPNVPMYFLVEGEGYETVEWHIYSDHDSLASNYWGVSGDKTKMVSVTPRTDMNGFGIYAVLTDVFGNTTQTTMAHMYITSQDKPAVTYYNIACSNCSANYSQACAGTLITVTTPGGGQRYNISVINSQGVEIASSSNQDVFTFTMPADSVGIYCSVIGTDPYNVNVYNSGEGGVAYTNQTTACPGELVTITLNQTNVQSNYVVVTSCGGQMVQHTMNFPYVTFTMPNGDVDVSVTWSLN